MLTAATLLFQRSYVERVDSYIAQICDGYAAAYKAQDTHDAMSFAAMLPEESARTLRFTLINADGTVLFDSKTSALVYDSTNTLYAVMDSNLPNHADRPEFRQAMEKGSASLTRESETMQTETHYYALRIDTPDGTQVLRVGEDIANIWGLSADTLPLLCAAVVLILLAATLFSWWLTRRMVQPINHLAEHLDTIEADVPYEELIPLARTIQTDRKLREDNETMRREFTANVSHELKDPADEHFRLCRADRDRHGQSRGHPDLCGPHPQGGAADDRACQRHSAAERAGQQSGQPHPRGSGRGCAGGSGRPCQGDRPEHDGQRPPRLCDAAV